MTHEQMQAANRVLAKVFGLGRYVATLQDGQLCVDAWTITDAPIAQSSILGTKFVPGYILDVGVVRDYRDIAPPDVDIQGVGESRSFAHVLAQLVGELAKMLAGQELENIGIEQMLLEESLRHG